jgi:Flp pilus assembly protein TadG
MKKPSNRRFFSDRDGVAAVEFAIVATLLAGLSLAMLEGWKSASQQSGAQAAANAGALYYLQGGTSDTAAQSFALAAWANAPSNASVAVQRQCTCAGVSWSCSTLCTTQLAPNTLLTITATATWQDNLVSQPIYAQEVVRVR